MSPWMILFTWSVSIALTGCSERVSISQRPNILLIVADDLGFTDIGAFGSEIQTPNLDQLAFGGVRLTNLHADRACQQTRVMMMASSGVSAALEYRPPQDGGQRANRLSLNWAILPELLQDAGYRTYMAGKWDLGLEEGYTPATRGFDHSFVQLGASASHFAEILWNERSLYELDGHPVEYQDMPEDFYSTNYYTQKMLEFLQSNEEAVPWFGYLPYTTPHWPLQVPENELERYAGQYEEGYDALRLSRVEQADELGVLPTGLTLEDFEPVASPWTELTEEEQRRYSRAQEIYAAMIENLDANVERLVNYLEESGQLANTVIMFTSDHGASSGEHGQRPGERPQIPNFINNSFSNWGRENSFVDHGLGFAEAATAPLRGYKGRISEGGLRAAAFINFPKLLSQGEVDGTFITMMDILPTLLDIAGTEHPGEIIYRGREINDIVGRSAWPYLTGVTETIHLPMDTAGWTSVQRYDSQTPLGALIRGNYKITNQIPAEETRSTAWQLYDISADPGETEDIASQYPDLMAELVEEWENNWR
jgi:arylsulfatase A-like enzyme